jgi:5-methylcytosine-specific restriction endonuclease McrA
MQKIISRKEAQKRNLKRYFTGIKCIKGHLSERITNCRHCVLCKKLQDKIHREKHGPYKSSMKAHLWAKLSSIKNQKKSKMASILEINLKEFHDWYDKNYNGECYYCGINIERYESEKLFIKYKVPGHRFGIDRMNSQDTYNLNNIAVCCSLCNSAKSFVFEADEFKEIARKYIRKLYG